MREINDVLHPMTQSTFLSTMQAVGEAVHAMNVEKGFYEKPSEFGTQVALMHSELSEALEAARTGDGPSEKIPEFSGVEEEMADAVIRIIDACQYRNLRLGQAILAKLAYNANRPHKHGGKAF